MVPTAKAPVKTGNLAGIIPGKGAAPKPVVPGAPDEEKPSLAKVKDLLQKAMDMLGELGANDQVESAPVIPPPAPRAPMTARRPAPPMA